MEKEEQGRIAREEKVILQTSSESDEDAGMSDGAVGGQTSSSTAQTLKRAKRQTY